MFAIFVLDGIGALLALGGSIIGCMGVCCTGQVVSDLFPRQLYSCFLGCQTPPPPPITTPPPPHSFKRETFCGEDWSRIYIAWHFKNGFFDMLWPLVTKALCITSFSVNRRIWWFFLCLFFFVFIRRLQLLLWSPLEWRRRKWTKVHLPRNILRSLAINSFELYQEHICPGWEDDRTCGDAFVLINHFAVYGYSSFAVTFQISLRGQPSVPGDGVWVSYLFIPFVTVDVEEIFPSH